MGWGYKIAVPKTGGENWFNRSIINNPALHWLIMLKFDTLMADVIQYGPPGTTELRELTSDQIQDGGRCSKFQSLKRCNSAGDCSISL